MKSLYGIHQYARITLLCGVSISCVGLAGCNMQADLLAVPGCESNGNSAENNPNCFTGSMGSFLRHSIFGEALALNFGSTLDFVEDYDGDGFPDFVVGDSHYGGGFYVTGKISVYSGRTKSLIFSKENHIQGLGMSAAGAGDFNNDGKADVITGIGHASQRVEVYSAASPHAIFSAQGEQPTGCFGYAVNSAGDFDGDGHDDVVVGDPCYDVNGIASTGDTDHTGKVYIYSGRTHALIASYLGPVPGAEFGFTVARVGDLNGDGRDDVVLGARFNGVFAYSGMNQNLLWSRTDGDLALIHEVSRAGDLNGDGVPDVVIGTRVGATYVLSGPDGAEVAHIPGLHTEVRVSAAGDYNNDGRDDVLISYVGEASVIVVSGRDRSILSASGQVDAYSHHFGAVVSGGGDLDGDGKADIIVSAPGYTHPLSPMKNGGQSTGAIYIYSQ